MTQLWVVRAGKQARYAEDFQTGEFIAVGFRDFFPEDLHSTSENELRRLATNRAERTYARELSDFAYRVEIGDYVIVPLLPTRRSYLVGQVSGPYHHITPVPRSGPHRRAMKWLGDVARDSLSTSATNSLGSIQTIFRPTTAEAELRARIAGLLSTAPP
jgi:restriction system protein